MITISKIDGRPKPWSFYVPPRLSGTGKYVRKYYSTKEEAQTALQLLENGVPQAREAIATLSGSEARDFVQAKRLLDEAGNGHSVLEAVRYYLRTHETRLPDKTFAAAYEDYITLKCEPDTKYWMSQRATLRKFEHLSERELQDLSAEDFWSVLKAIPESTRAQHMRHLRAVFNYAMSAKDGGPYLARNPIHALHIPDTTPNGPIEIYAPETVEKYLTYALDYELALLPYFVLGFFCGVRPEGELRKLEWSAVDWHRGRLNIPAHVAKGGKRARPIDIPENALAWLAAYRSRSGAVEGNVLALTNKQLRDARAVANKIAGARWIQDGMRHSFATYHVALYDDPITTGLRMGHLGTLMMGRHYVAGVHKEEGAKYFAIAPRELPENVVAIRA